MGLFTRALFPRFNDLWCNQLSVGDLTKPRHDVNEHRSWVDSPAELARAVIIGKHVVVVVPPFTEGQRGDERILGGMNCVVIRVGAPQVRGAVYQPRGVQDQTESEQGRY